MYRPAQPIPVHPTRLIGRSCPFMALSQLNFVWKSEWYEL